MALSPILRHASDLPTDRPDRGEPIRVLLIHDEEDDYVLTRDLLAEEPFWVEWAPGYPEGRGVIAEGRHDVYLVDYHLGAKNGLELIREAVESGCPAPMVLLAEHRDQGLEDQALQAGAADYLPLSELDARILSRSIRYALAQTAALSTIRESEERFRRAFEEASIGMALIDVGTDRFLRVNQALCDMLGYREEDLEGMTWKEITLPEDLQLTAEEAGRLLDGELTSFRVEKRYLHTDGSPLWAAVTSSLVRDRSGRPLHFVCQIEDLGDVKEAEAAIRAGEERYRTLVERIPVGVYRVGSDGHILDVNPAAAEMLGYPSDEPLVGSQARDLYMNPEDHEHFKELLRREGTVSVDLPLLHRNGTRVWARVRARAERDDDGHIRYIEGTLEDVTEQRRAERELAQRAAQQASVADLGRLALEEAVVQELLDRAAEVVADLLEVDLTGVLELRPGGEDLLLRAGRGWPPGRVGRGLISAKGASLAAYTLETGEPVIVGDLPTEKRFTDPELATRFRVRSGLSAPIVGKGRPFGVLDAFSRQRRHFGPDDIHFLLSVANVVATAVERARVQAELMDSEERFRQAFDRSPIGKSLVRLPEETFFRTNPAIRSFLGRSEGELAGTTVSELTHPDDLEADRAHMRRLLAGEIDHFQMEKRFVRPDGEAVWGSLFVSLVHDDAGRPVYTLGQIQDITQRKRMEEHRARLVAILESTSDFVGTASPEGRTVYVNRAGKRMVGIPEGEEVEGLPIEVYHPEWAHRMIVEVAIPAALTRGTWSGESALLHRDGHEIPVSQVIIAHRGSDAHPAYLSTIMRDISGRKAAEERLEELVRSKDEFIASISHELRTPLAAVVGFAELLRGDAEALSADERREMVELISTQALDLTNIVEDLLVAARADIGRLTVSRVPIDLRAQMAQVLEAWTDGWKDAIEIEGSAPRALGDPTRVRQILRNLLTNALRYGGSTVRVRLTHDRDGVRITVADDGAGIPEELRESVFEPYFRSQDRPGQPGSMGLGLTVSRRLARLMEGDLTYHFEDGWSTFELTLPAT